LYFSDPASGSVVHFDLFTALKWRSFDFLRCDRFLARKRNLGLFAVPHAAHEAATSLLATMIYTGQVKDKYKAGIKAGFAAEPDEATALLAQTYGQHLAQFIMAAGAAEKWSDLEAATPALRRALIFRQLFGHPVRTFGSFFSDTKRVLKRLRQPPGISLVLCGADGCGKSTVGALLSES